MPPARAEEVEMGLAVGGDAHLTKPFSPRELVARVRAMLRRPRAQAPADGEVAARQFGDLAVDPAAREVSVGGRPVEPTKLEVDLLDTLSARPRGAFRPRPPVAR